MSADSANAARRTPAAPVELRGVGLFTGTPASLTISPAESAEGHAGIWFNRRGLPAIAAVAANVVQPPGLPGRCTCIGRERNIFLTIEHVMSALIGLGVTDAFIELDGPEVPMLDGSARPFAAAIAEAGLAALAGEARMAHVSATIRVEDGRGGWAEARPRHVPGASYRYELDYTAMPGGAGLGRQDAAWEGDAAGYMRDIAPARTFCLAAEARAMSAAGLFKHLSPSDMLVIDEAGAPVDNTWRLPNEAARHKLLDLIGDVALCGAMVHADIVAHRSGHALNQELALRLAATLSKVGSTTRAHPNSGL